MKAFAFLLLWLTGSVASFAQGGINNMTCYPYTGRTCYTSITDPVASGSLYCKWRAVAPQTTMQCRPNTTCIGLCKGTI
jgi:hypothetical protein